MTLIRYLAIKFQEMEDKMRFEKNRNRENNEEQENSTEDTTTEDSNEETEESIPTENPMTVSTWDMFRFKCNSYL